MKMHKILVASAVVLGAAFMASCEDDNDSNPILHMPDTFALNEPALAADVISLQNTTDSIRFTWSQPDYGGMPLITTYKLQYLVSNDGTGITTGEDGKYAFTDESLVKEYDESKTTCSYALDAATLNKALLTAAGVKTEDAVPEKFDVYYRVSAQTASTEKVYSNIVKMSYAPYYVRLEKAEPVTWYLIGNCFGEGTWGGDLMTGMLPLYYTAESYSEDTGYGTVSWTGYISDSFKLRGSLEDNWATQIGQGDSFGEYKINDGGSGNIAPDPGYYTISIDTKKVAQGDVSGISITPTEAATAFTEFYINGSFNDWGDGVAMTPVNTAAGMENHDWYTYIHLPAASNVKFQTGNWSTEIGSKYDETPSCKTGYYGVGAKSGGWNIYITAEADYLVIVNDITGAFRFIKQ